MRHTTISRLNAQQLTTSGKYLLQISVLFSFLFVALSPRKNGIFSRYVANIDQNRVVIK